MLFNSLAYLIFLPLVFLCYWTTKRVQWQNAVVLLASMTFYGWWDVRFLGLMLLTCGANWALLQCLFRQDIRPSYRRAALLTAIVLDLGLLGVFKYFNFFIDNLSGMCSLLGLHVSVPTLSLILPVGISFYTFQLVSYIIDTYRNPPSPSERPSIFTFFCFVSFFPQLVAGPIERGSDLMGQLQKPRSFTYEDGQEGMRLILWGLMKKMLLADNCANVVNLIFASHDTVTTADLWLGAVAFAFQVYGDFSGYSDIAIGSARLFGVRLSRNFDSPFFSATIPELWRRWHMTLMRWFRDYVYIPLGGSRCSSGRRAMNILAVYALSGLWHGASWNYIMWGLFNAVWFFVPHRFLAFPLFAIGLVIFRSPDLATAWEYIIGMFDPNRLGGITHSRMCLVYIAAFMLAEWCMKRRPHPFLFPNHGVLSTQVVRLSIYLVCFIITLILGGEQMAFIYFQF